MDSDVLRRRTESSLKTARGFSIASLVGLGLYIALEYIPALDYEVVNPEAILDGWRLSDVALMATGLNTVFSGITIAAAKRRFEKYASIEDDSSE